MSHTNNLNCEKANIEIIDGLFICYVIITGINFYYLSQKDFFLFEAAKWCSIILCYILSRKISNKQLILWGISLIGIIETSIAIYQRFYSINSTHQTFNILGTFNNPGPLGGYLSIVITIIVGLYMSYKTNALLKHLLFTLIIILLFTLILTESRAGWLSAITGVGSLYLFKRNERKRTLSIHHKCCLTILIASFIVFAYFYKKDSANGRLLIWRISTEMIKSSPLTGHGVGSFEKKYMYYQAQYFKSHPHSGYANLADNIVYPYNEFLRIIIEQGVIGFVMTLAIIVIIYKAPLFKKCNTIYLGAFTSLITFSLFSYTFNIPLIWLQIPLLMGGIQFKKSFCVPSRLNFHLEWIVCVICLIIIFKSSYDYHQLHQAIKKLHSTSASERKKAEIHIENHQNEINSAPRLLDIYTQYCFQNLPIKYSLPVLKKATNIIPSCELYCDLGDVYKEQNNFDKAKKCYRLAKYMLPNRLLPKHKLFCLYRVQGDSIKMNKIGNEILLTEIKIPNTKALRIKADIINCMNER